jgi:hypothetical protein
MTCYKPMVLKSRNYQVVNCGRCWGCRLEYARQWSVRIMHELRYHDESMFLSLTYRDDALTWGLNRPTLVPRDLQLFWKRLRKETNANIRYFGCGEYGDKLGRPHYHACVFGYRPKDAVLEQVKNGNRLYSSDLLARIWSHGRIDFGEVTFQSASYVARYVMKKHLGKDKDYYEREAIEPEFVRMSRRPGIGSQHFDDFKYDMFPNDFNVVNGCKSRPPRYYSQLLEQLDPVLYATIKAKRIEEQWKAVDSCNIKRLAVKERIKKAQTKTLTRSLE